MFRQDWVEDMMGDSSVDHLFHECSFSPPFLGTVHTHYEELKDLSDDIAKRTTFMHYAHIPDDLDLSRWAGAAKRHQVFAF